MTGKSFGFTLLEMSIVLVIIGLLMGMVLTGRTLIRSVELARIVNAKNQLMSDIHLFQSRFGQWPGDFDNHDNALPGAVPGDNNSVISYTDGGISDTWQEVDNVYADLSLAGLTNAHYVTANLHIAGGPFTWNVGTNAPAAPQLNTVFWIGAQANSFYGREALKYNTIMLTGLDIRQGGLPLQDAISLDNKYDDGNAATGTIRSYAPWDGTANTCTNNAATAASASYLPTVAANGTIHDCVVEMATF